MFIYVCAKIHIIPGSVWYSVIHLDMTKIMVTPNLCTWQTQQRHQTRALHKLWGPHQCQSIKVLRFYRIEGYLVRGGENRMYNLFIFERGLKDIHTLIHYHLHWTTNPGERTQCTHRHKYGHMKAPHTKCALCSSLKVRLWVPLCVLVHTTGCIIYQTRGKICVCVCVENAENDRVNNIAS